MKNASRVRSRDPEALKLFPQCRFLIVAVSPSRFWGCSMPSHTLPQSRPQARSRQREAGAVMQGAFLDALRGRVARDPAGRVILPTGPAKATEVARVISALDRASQADGRR